MLNPVFIPERVGELVDLMRDRLQLLSFTDMTGNRYSIQAKDLKSIAAGDYITIENTSNFNGEYRIISINSTEKSFLIEAPSGFATETGTAKAKKPYYIYGHPKEIAGIFTVSEMVPNLKNQRYPVICLFMDFEEDMFPAENQWCEANLWIAIVNRTDKSYTTAQRYQHNFKPVLYPIYLKFLETIQQNQLRTLYLKPKRIEHKKKDCPFYSTEGKEQNVLNDFVDAIELKELKLNFLLNITC